MIKNNSNLLKMPLMFIKGIFIVLFFSTNSIAQENSFLDSIVSSFKYKPKIDFRLDSRTSFIATQPARINGVKIGLNFGNRFKLGIGYNWLQSDILKRQTAQFNKENITLVSRLQLRYISPYVEYTYYNSKKLELSIPIQFGIGFSEYVYLNDQFNLLPPENRNFIFLYEPYSVGTYKPVPWFGVGFGVGYRIVFIGNNGLGNNFNSPIYVFKLKLIVEEIYRFFK